MTGVVRRDRSTPGTRRHRALPPGRQALMALVYLRKGETFTALACGSAVSTATAWRYVNRTVELPTARAPKLQAALCRAARDGLLYLVRAGKHNGIMRKSTPHYTKAASRMRSASSPSSTDRNFLINASTKFFSRWLA
ncbi:helix-turn-helix domain-containing protein [Spirillospora sp. CA-253888]